ncbi:hypothetical protein NMY22_g14417 [Coprinellus aureogranulatus]|nr:hypothetical protein NMY22_g14417 [Coprinellus aureogranulatus]
MGVSLELAASRRCLTYLILDLAQTGYDSRMQSLERDRGRPYREGDIVLRVDPGRAQTGIGARDVSELAGSAIVPAKTALNWETALTATGMFQWSDIPAASFDMSIERSGASLWHAIATFDGRNSTSRIPANHPNQVPTASICRPSPSTTFAARPDEYPSRMPSRNSHFRSPASINHPQTTLPPRIILPKIRGVPGCSLTAETIGFVSPARTSKLVVYAQRTPIPHRDSNPICPMN